MASSQGASQDNNPFVMPESGSTIAWLFNLDKNVTKAMGGVLSEGDNDLSGLHSILDLGCGSGGWVLEVASQNPEISVTGVDLNESLINYVRAHAKVRGFDNAYFSVMNILQPMDFPDESFDLINARTLFSSLAPADWPPLLQECKRLLRPGGILRLTELERHNSSSPALEQIWDLYARAFYVTGRSFSPDGKHIGIVPHLGRLLYEAGFQNIQNKAHVIDISGWTPDFEAWRQQDDIAWALNEKFIVESGVITQEEFRRLREQAELEWLSEDFNGIAFFFTAWGSKPEDSARGE
jgi:ubiquinone/menaquinone biosynthesis C-methylase UbiE